MLQIKLICSIQSLSSGVTALQRALVLMQVFGRRLPVSVSVLIWIFTFEFQPESSANKFHVSGYFGPVDFCAYKTAGL